MRAFSARGALALLTGTLSCAVGMLACGSFSGAEGDDVASGSDATTMPDASIPDDASSAVDARTPTDGSTMPDVRDAAPAHDAQFGIACGAATCVEREAGAEACCYNENNPAEPYLCAGKKDICTPADARRYLCDDPDDCTVLGFPGAVCCADLVPSILANTYELDMAVCVQAVNCAVGNEVLRCDRALANQCPGGKACSTLTSLAAPGDASTWTLDKPFAACER